MKGMDLIKYIYDNNLIETEVVLGVQGFTADMHHDEDEEPICSVTPDGRLLISDSCGEYDECFKKLDWYTVTVTETFSRTFAVQAKDYEDAESKVEEAYSDNDITVTDSSENPDNTEYNCNGEIDASEARNYEVVEGDD